MQKYIVLTFDIEEFDLPKEFHEPISEKREIDISSRGFHIILNLLKEEGVPATFFVTAKFAMHHKRLIRKVAKHHEIALHGLFHHDDYRKMKPDEMVSRIKKAKKIVEKIAGKEVIGFRAPRFHIKKIKRLFKTGILYDSSMHPTYIPRRYNNFFTEKSIHRHGKIVEMPVSVTPLIRLPLFWFVFRNLGLNYAKICTNLCFIDSDYTMLLFHPWEFVNLNNLEFKIPLYLRRNTGKKLEDMLREYIRWAKRKNKFTTAREFLKNKRHLI